MPCCSMSDGEDEMPAMSTMPRLAAGIDLSDKYSAAESPPPEQLTPSETMIGVRREQ
jgi:hypothetical protein